MLVVCLAFVGLLHNDNDNDGRSSGYLFVGLRNFSRNPAVAEAKALSGDLAHLHGSTDADSVHRILVLHRIAARNLLGQVGFYLKKNLIKLFSLRIIHLCLD